MRRVLLTLLPLTLVGCGTQASPEDGIQVVTSTNVYASLASEVAGEAASVSAIIDDPADDPHSYEATPQDTLELSKADVVVLNGGGYDSFMTTMLESLDSQPIVVDAVEVSGLQEEGSAEDVAHEDAHASEEHAPDDGHDHTFNEHVWYSVPAMEQVNVAIADALRESGASVDANESRQAASLKDLSARIDEARSAHEGASVGLTEPVAGYLFEDMGLHNEIDPAFTSAVESGDEAPAAAQQAADQLVGDLALLAVNEQTSGRGVDALTARAREEGVPVVPVSETLPEGVTYLDWMNGTLDRLDEALAA